MYKNPLLITGIHRSGSTWLASMLSLNKDTILIDEPFNIGEWAYKLGGLAKVYYSYIPDLDEVKARKKFQLVLDNKTRRVFSKRKKEHWLPWTRSGKQIIKDPIAALSSEWLYNQFDIDILVLIRHPAAYVSSLKRMNWDFPFDHLSSQKKLMETELHSLKNEINNVPSNFVERAALSWKCIYFVLSEYIERNSWPYKLHEDLARDPLLEIKELYSSLNLKWNKKIEVTIRSYTDSSNPVKVKKGKTHQLKRDSKNLIYKWKNDLSDKEIISIKKITAPVWEKFYNESDW